MSSSSYEKFMIAVCVLVMLFTLFLMVFVMSEYLQEKEKDIGDFWVTIYMEFLLFVLFGLMLWLMILEINVLNAVDPLKKRKLQRQAKAVTITAFIYFALLIVAALSIHFLYNPKDTQKLGTDTQEIAKLEQEDQSRRATTDTQTLNEPPPKKVDVTFDGELISEFFLKGVNPHEERDKFKSELQNNNLVIKINDKIWKSIGLTDDQVQKIKSIKLAKNYISVVDGNEKELRKINTSFSEYQERLK